MDTTAYSTANIGRKVRELRLHLGLTQAALAGEVITRNMLSCIENGAALPSVETLLYLSGRLHVSAAYLLSSGSEDDQYRKLAAIDVIRLLYRQQKYDACLQMCRQLELRDEEIRHLEFLCEFGLAESCRQAMHLSSAAVHYRTAAGAEGETLYTENERREQAAFYLLLMEHVAEAVLPDELFAPRRGVSAEELLFLRCYGLFRAGRQEEAEALRRCGLIRGTACCQMLEAASAIAGDDRLRAIPRLHAVLADSGAGFYLLYHALEDLESCCESMENYRDAYSLSKRRLSLQETFQK